MQHWYLQVFFTFFPNFNFWGQKSKIWPKMTKNYACCTPYLVRIHHMIVFFVAQVSFFQNFGFLVYQELYLIWLVFGTHAKWYLQQFFSFFKNSNFAVSSSINAKNRNSEVCPTFFTCVWFFYKNALISVNLKILIKTGFYP